MTNKKSILCIVPLPPPITGAAAASETVINYLKQYYEVVVMPYQRGNLISGKFSLRQFLKIIKIGVQLKLLRRDFDIVYLVISSSFWGHLRDLFFLVIFGNRLRGKTVMHLHSAYYKRDISLILPSILRNLTTKLFMKVCKGIVVGETWSGIYGNKISNNSIYIVKNCYDSFLLIPEDIISAKFNSIKRVNILFLSNLIKEKGYDILLDAFLSLPESVRNKSELHFAGEVFPVEDKVPFLNKIKNRKNIFYHGPVSKTEKKKILWNAHVLCFPTYYRYEAQPIVILEAYASGCIVLTTNKGGIKDIFVDGKNGFFIKNNTDMSVDIMDLKTKLEMIILDLDKYKNTVYFNHKEAKSKYTEEIYCKNIEKILTEENVV